MSHSESQHAQTEESQADQQGQKSETKTDQQKSVEFDGPFDEERAKRLIANLKSDLAKKDKAREELAVKVQKYEDENKTESEKLLSAKEAAEKRADEAEERLMRAEVAAEKGLTAKQAKRLTGTTREELEADADELLAEFAPTKSASPDLKQGVRSTSSQGQLTREDIAGMSPQEVDKARREGRLDRVLGKTH